MLVAIELIALHKLDGTIAYVNPSHVVQLAETREMDGDRPSQLHEDVECVITLLDGKFVSVRETCDEIRKLFVKEKK